MFMRLDAELVTQTPAGSISVSARVAVAVSRAAQQRFPVWFSILHQPFQVLPSVGCLKARACSVMAIACFLSTHEVNHDLFSLNLQSTVRLTEATHDAIVERACGKQLQFPS